MAKKIGLGVAVLVLAVVIAVVRSILEFSEQEDKSKLFAPHITSFLEDPVLASTGDSPYLQGKVVTIDVSNKVVDTFTYPKLSEEIRAKNPTEVGTVVRIVWDQEQAGVYNGCSPQHRCENKK